MDLPLYQRCRSNKHHGAYFITLLAVVYNQAVLIGRVHIHAPLGLGVINF